MCRAPTIDQRFTGRSSHTWGCTTEVFLPMYLSTCFEAGRFTQIQTSRTALCCSRKWMSGPADALTPTLTNRIRSIVALTVVFIIQPIQIPRGSTGRSVFSLDKYLSWMPHGAPGPACIPGKPLRSESDAPENWLRSAESPFGESFKWPDHAHR